MQSKITDALVYMIANYPKPQHLSKARVTKLVYLADWVAALHFGRQITDIQWYFNHYGPYVDDVVKAARLDSRLVVVPTTNFYGSPMERVALAEGHRSDARLDDWEIRVINHVVEQTKDLGWDDFIRAVYSTYPILTQPRGSVLNLVELATLYRATSGSSA